MQEILRRLQTGYASQAASDAQSQNYGNRSYWDELERSSLRTYVYFAEHGDMDKAREMLTRSLSQALAGNDGE